MLFALLIQKAIGYPVAEHSPAKTEIENLLTTKAAKIVCTILEQYHTTTLKTKITTKIFLFILLQ